MGRGWLFGSSSRRRPVSPLVRPTDIAQQTPAINPARFRHEVAFGTASTTQDGFGQPLTTWPVYLTTWAEIKQLSGQELFQGDEFTSASQVRIAIRWPGPGITINVGDRIFFGSHCYVVQIVNDLFLQNIEIQLTCLEIDGSS